MPLVIVTTEDFETFDPFTATDAAIIEMMTDPAFIAWRAEQDAAFAGPGRCDLCGQPCGEGEAHAACEDAEAY